MNLTKDNTMTNLSAPRSIEVGRGNPFILGDKPLSIVVFFCPSFFNQRIFAPVQIIMTALRWRPLRSVAPSSGISTRFNAVANTVESIDDGFTHSILGIHQ